MSRAQFKYALRPFRLEERSITSTKLAYHMQSLEFNDFWKEIRKQNKAKSALSNCVAGVTGETAIADMWRNHYEELLNSSANSHETRCTRGDARSFFCTYKTYLYAQN